MGDTMAETTVHRWTADQYEQLVAAYDLDRVELVNGVLYDVSPESWLHTSGVLAAYHELQKRYPDHCVRPAGSVLLDDTSLWNPDVFVTRAPPVGDYPVAADVVVAVEVSVTAMAKDTGPKLAVYARNGIPEYWVVDPRGELMTVVRYTDPSGETYLSEETFQLAAEPG